jgi:RND superfamily putative drug exporter
MIILVALGLAAARFYQAPSSSISIPGTKAQQSIDRVGELFPNSGGASGRVVFHATDGTIISNEAAITNVVKKIGTVDGVAMAVSPFASENFISEDGKTAYAQIQLDGQIGSIKESTQTAIDTIVENGRSDSLQVEVGGDLSQKVPGEIVGAGELIGVAVALMVLVITLGSLIAGGMPILSAVTAVGVSMAGLFALSQVFDINSTTPVLAVMLVAG